MLLRPPDQQLVGDLADLVAMRVRTPPLANATASGNHRVRTPPLLNTSASRQCHQNTGFQFQNNCQVTKTPCDLNVLMSIPRDMNEKKKKSTNYAYSVISNAGY